MAWMAADAEVAIDDALLEWSNCEEPERPSSSSGSLAGVAVSAGGGKGVGGVVLSWMALVLLILPSGLQAAIVGSSWVSLLAPSTVGTMPLLFINSV